MKKKESAIIARRTQATGAPSDCDVLTAMSGRPLSAVWTLLREHYTVTKYAPDGRWERARCKHCLAWEHCANSTRPGPALAICSAGPAQMQAHLVNKHSEFMDPAAVCPADSVSQAASSCNDASCSEATSSVSSSSSVGPRMVCLQSRDLFLLAYCIHCR